MLHVKILTFTWQMQKSKVFSDATSLWNIQALKLLWQMRNPRKYRGITWNCCVLCHFAYCLFGPCNSNDPTMSAKDIGKKLFEYMVGKWDADNSGCLSLEEFHSNKCGVIWDCWEKAQKYMTVSMTMTVGAWIWKSGSWPWQNSPRPADKFYTKECRFTSSSSLC